MTVDVHADIQIDRPRDHVSAYACDPANATAWYRNIARSELLTDGPLRVGSRIAFVAQFLGRRLAYTYEVRELVPGRRLVMSTSDGPFAMETTYTWTDAGPGATRMTLRNRGEPSGFSKMGAPAMSVAMRRANRKDLERLRSILEAAEAVTPA